MFNFFNRNTNHSPEAVEKYKQQLIAAMHEEGATPEDFEMFTDDLFHDIVLSAMSNHRSPKEVAWALLQ